MAYHINTIYCTRHHKQCVNNICIQSFFCVMNADCACYLGAITNTMTFMSLLMKTNEPAKRKILWKAEWTKSIAVVASIWIYSAKRTRHTQKKLLKMLDKRVESVILIKLKALLLQNAMQSVRLMFRSILTDGRTVLICHNFTNRVWTWNHLSKLTTIFYMIEIHTFNNLNRFLFTRDEINSFN